MSARAWAWKELREQGPLVGLVVVLSLAVAGGLAWLALSQPPYDLATSRQRPQILGVLMAGAALAATLVGSSAIAGEREGGTLSFLEHAAGGRIAVWRAKQWFAVLATLAASGLMLGAMIAARAEGGIVAWTCALTGTFLAGTLLFTSFARSALAASGMTVAAMSALSVGTGLFLSAGPGGRVSPHAYVVVWTACWAIPALVGAAAGRRIYCGAELAGRPRSTVEGPRAPLIQGAGRTLWLMARQSGWVLIAVPILGFLPSFWGGNEYYDRFPTRLATLRIFYRPAVLVVLGVVAGVGAFSGDNRGEARRLWTDARLPVGRLWLTKLLLWTLWALLIMGLWTLGLPAEESFSAAGFDLLGTRAYQLDAAALLHGLAVGALVAMCVRKSASAVVLALMAAFPLAAIWLPSAVMGDFQPLWMFAPPLLVLTTARAIAWPWVCGTLTMSQSRACLALGGLATAAAVGGALSYRAWSVPAFPAAALGEFPRDWTWSRATSSSVSALEAKLVRRDRPPRLRPDATLNFEELLRHEQPLRSEMWNRWMQRVPPPPNERAADPGSAGGMGSGPPGFFYRDSQTGEPRPLPLWPLPLWETPGGARTSLDDYFDAGTSEQIAAWADLPPTVLPSARSIDPRGVTESRELAGLLLLRDLELVERGQAAEALDLIFGTLALTRFQRVEAHAAVYRFAADAERAALAILDRWVQRQVREGPHTELLQRAAQGMARHAQAAPPPRTVVDGLWLRVHEPGMLEGITSHEPGEAPELRELLWVAPWEATRRQRITEWTFDGWYQAVDKSFPLSTPDVKQIAGRYWEPSRTFIDSGMDAKRFAARAHKSLNSLAFWTHVQRYGMSAPTQALVFETSRRNIQGLELSIACVRHHLSEGRYPKTVAELAPKYIAEAGAFAAWRVLDDGRDAALISSDVVSLVPSTDAEFAGMLLRDGAVPLGQMPSALLERDPPAAPCFVYPLPDWPESQGE